MDDHDRLDVFAVEDLEYFEKYERRSVFIPETRNNDLEDLDDVDFRRRYRFNKSTIEEIISLLSPRLNSVTGRNNALSASEKVLAAVRFFAFGSHQINIGVMHRVSQPSASRAINEVAKCLAELRPQFIYLPQSEADRVEISQNFYRKFNFPAVYGALDCTLIKILNPGGFRAETFRCRKGFFALNVQTLSDADLYIRNLVVRWPGSAHDSTIFDNSYLRAHLETEVPSRYHVLGDSGYPLRSYLMTPYVNPANAYQMRYNAAHILARNVVERQYGVWKRRFACISSPLRCKLENAQTIIVATAVLHNLALTLGDTYEECEILPQENDFQNNEHQLGGIAKRNAIVANFFTN